MVLSNSSSGIPGLHHHTQLLCGPVVLNSDSFTCVPGALPVSAIFLFFFTVFSLSYLPLFMHKSHFKLFTHFNLP